MAGNLRGVDVWFDGHHLETLTTALVIRRIPTVPALAAAIAIANLALDNELLTSVRRARSMSPLHSLTRP